jgi:preprotein translocase subunit SecD
MYLGLDLRGGVHFLLQVDMKGALTKRLDSVAADLRTLLRDKNVRHGGHRCASGQVVAGPVSATPRCPRQGEAAVHRQTASPTCNWSDAPDRRRLYRLVVNPHAAGRSRRIQDDSR